MTYSFPCTDLSVAGKMQGMSKADWQNGNATRSGLLWEVERILKECDELPQVLLMENVPQVHAEQNRTDFESWLNFLRGKGYHNFYKDLNAKDYGIPQNRDRCFCVSILSPDFIEYDFPETVKLESVMKDYLEESVDEKYYINNDKARQLIAQLANSGVLPTEQNRTACSQLICVSSPDCSKSRLVSAQDTTQELKSTISRQAAYLNYKRIEATNCSIAKTLCARDYKGFGTGFDTMNGVIEWQK
jgi:site-specific DNA-cytosine methylase